MPTQPGNRKSAITGHAMPSQSQPRFNFPIVLRSHSAFADSHSPFPLLPVHEPTGNLDATIGADILRLLAEMNKAGQTIVMVTHDAQVAALAHRQVTLREGAISEAGGRAGAGQPPAATTRKVAP